MKLIKLVELFLSEPVEVRFEEVRSLLNAFGSEEVRSKGVIASFATLLGKHKLFRRRADKK
ncbi:MAG: hypothetical protein C4288_11495 [Leptolyngbya sp. ERB_1_1]